MKNIAHLLVMLLAASEAQAQVTVTDKAILRSGKHKLDIHYPQTGSPEIDRHLARQARDLSTELNEESGEKPASASMSYKVRRNDAQMFSVQFYTYTYYDGQAHGMPDMVSYNFLMPDAQQVFLPELVDGQRGLERINRLVIADLTRQLGPSDGWTRPRVGPERDFAWLPDALEIKYTPYVVAGYAQGYLTVRIPFSELDDVIRPDPRAPAPSFSCAAARSAIEKTVCSDAALARQDRQLAELYVAKLPSTAGRDGRHGESAAYRKAEQTKYEALVASQRAWLLRRNKACADGNKACLASLYRDRQKDMYRSPF